jgi:hypothetical protein
MVIFTLIIDHFKASASPDEPRRKLKRLLAWTNKQEPGTRRIITMPDESGDDSDPTKEPRRNYLRWAFWGASAFSLAIYLLKGVIISSTGLYIIKASLLTCFATGISCM